MENLNDYKDLGWQRRTQIEEVKNCYDKSHLPRTTDNSRFVGRCSDVIYICDICKIIWHVDESD